MVRKLVALVVAMVIADAILSSAHACYLQVTPEREQISRDVKAALLAEDFAKLDGLADAFASTKARTSDGIWRLMQFQRALRSTDCLVGNGLRPLEEADFQFIEAKMTSWIAHNPRSPAARVAYADTLIGHGYLLRGTGLANSVTAEGWHDFVDYLAKAQASLDAAQPFAATYPAWHATRLDLANYEQLPRDAYVLIMKEAIRAAPDYFGIYEGMAGRALPQWGGSFEAIDWVARLAADQTSATEGQENYARVYLYLLARNEQINDIFKDPALDWPRMMKGLSDIDARYPDAWNLNRHALIACRRSDPHTGELLARISGNVLSAVWDQETYQRCLEHFAPELCKPKSPPPKAPPTPSPAGLVPLPPARSHLMPMVPASSKLVPVAP